MSRKHPDDEPFEDVNLHDEPMEKMGEMPDDEDTAAIFEDCYSLLDEIIEATTSEDLRCRALKMQQRLSETLGWYSIQ